MANGMIKLFDIRQGPRSMGKYHEHENWIVNIDIHQVGRRVWPGAGGGEGSYPSEVISGTILRIIKS